MIVPERNPSTPIAATSTNGPSPAVPINGMMTAFIANPAAATWAWRRIRSATKRARTATGEERARLWEKALEFWPPYADYQRKTEREIPVVVLDPVC